jgi:serine/threonine protein kinase
MTDITTKRPVSRRLRARSRLGKYRIESCLDEGAFSNVYSAQDTIEGRRAALKIPHPHLADEEFLEGFRKEVRLAARIQHPRILEIKDASFIDGMFVMAYPLGTENLSSRLARRVSANHLAIFMDQVLEAVSEVHRRRIIHCDIKPENFILFPGTELKLADLGIARFAFRTLRGSGSGTLGHMAPEQAFGRPSARSDVFAVGLLLYRMLSGKYPEYPFDWPPPAYDRFRAKARPELVEIIRKCLQVSPKKRFRDGMALYRCYKTIRDKPFRSRSR